MISPAARRALEEALGAQLRFDVPLGRHTSLGVGGPADALALPESADATLRCVEACARNEVPLCVLGGGFNTLVRDAGVEGVVLRLQRLRALRVEPGERLRADAGVSHAQVTRLCADEGLAGLEFAAGIPGTVAS